MFFVFTITGFFHAVILRPLRADGRSACATSILINTLIAGSRTSAVRLAFYVPIIVIQTSSIGFGTVIGEKLAEQSEERRRRSPSSRRRSRRTPAARASCVDQAREAGVLDERARMAREIHDTIAHGLTGIVTQLEAAEQASRPSGRPAAPHRQRRSGWHARA